MKSLFFYLLFLVIGHYSLSAQQLTGQELLEKSIQYHDPQNNWDTFEGTLHFTETRPNGPDRQTSIQLDNAKSYFYLTQKRAGSQIEKIIKGGECSYTVDGATVVADSLVQKLRLSCSQIQRMRNYYVYLWGMPMKLRDQGTIIDKEVATITFMDQSVLSMKVTYEKEVGEDIWYFYFNPTTYALVGYRFYHDEAVNDGEYIPLEGEEEINQIRFPKARTWFVNKDDRLLGTDILENNK